MKKTRSFLLAAGISLAMAFTFVTSICSCVSYKVVNTGTEIALASFTDSRDGKTYKTVKIGEQIWMAENLNYKVSGSKCYGEDGQVTTGYETRGPIASATLSSEQVQANCEKYGRLYFWGTAMEACPEGWHLPDKEEWQTLVNFAGGESVAGKRLKARSGWNNNGNGIDIYGFSALPGGQGNSAGFSAIGFGGIWWASSAGYYFGMSYSADGAVVVEVEGDESILVYVRCVQGEAQSSAASGVSGEQQGALKRYEEAIQKAQQEYQEAIQKPQREYEEAQKAYQEVMQKAYQEYVEAQKRYGEATQKEQQELQEAQKRYSEAIQKPQQEYQEALQKARQEPQKEQQEQQEAAKRYSEATQKPQQEYQEAAKRYSEATQKPQQEWQEAQKRYSEAMQKPQQEQQEAAKRYSEAMQKPQQEYQEALQKALQEYQEATQK